MFEKEAEEWVIDNVCSDCSKYEKCKSKEHCTCKECSKEKWQKGAEFGYNKANEWHKTSEKLPKDCSLVLAYGFDDTEPTLYYYVASDTWEWMPKRIAVYSNDQIRLWKEIILPKESE